MNRLALTFNHLVKEGKKAFVPYIMAGDGGLGSLQERLKILEKLGAAAIEVGVPFSDPVADGPTIQLAGARALTNGTTLRGIIGELGRIRDEISVPLILMTYLNPIYSYGVNKFVRDLKYAGIDGCIIPDLPIEEEDLIAPILDEAQIELIRLVTLTTPLDRVKKITERGNGFIYTVTVKGVTGIRKEYNDELSQFLKKVKEISPIPILAGFGISNESQINDLIQYCDGVIVGSKIVEWFAENKLQEIEKLMAPFKQTIKVK